MKDFVWLAEIDTSHFSFKCIGETAVDALTGMLEGWKVHANQTQADPDYLQNNADGINLMPIRLGALVRDTSHVSGGDPFDDSNVQSAHRLAFKKLGLTN